MCSGLSDTPRDKYTRNLLNAFLPDGYVEITPGTARRVRRALGALQCHDPRHKKRLTSMMLYNMSAPPRTEVRAEKRAIADRIVVFSLVYALAVRGFLKPMRERKTCPKGREFQSIPWDRSPDLRDAIKGAGHRRRTFRRNRRARPFDRVRFPDPLAVGVFTNGWHCLDPQIVAGLQARRSAISTFPAAGPDLSWERLVSAPIAFDEPAVSALFP